MADVLKGKTVVVFGASNGIGAAVAELALAEGASVMAISRSGVGPKGSKGVAVDVADLRALTCALEAAGEIDHLVYTVGARLGSPALSTLTDDVLPLAFETKLFSAVHAIRLALPHLSPNASITLTSGQVSRKYGVGSLVKGTVNAAVDAAGRHLAKELAPRRVNVVSPGVVDTSLWGEAGSEGRAATIARVSSALPVKRVGAPAELAQAYLFAMTNGFVTGALIDVDGGGLL
ncbi:SDR family oxidoreductase [Phenylobacterium sp.]|uniref:SDR family oxidoreductase n=1 Tax=Phenylobacterium sp. TaxID=1871053 RepID=UPI002E333395|nr:SDR family oxidoreductase [Phenylobacterium sp.]HEX4711244.1 SDR family oxidoreductase [Phenylobacterium sp.]